MSDLGGGKTAFVRGLADGLGSKAAVRSPSFTLGNEYPAGELTLHHFDFYRLSEPGLMQAQLAEILKDPKAIVAIEWPGSAENDLPPDRLQVRLIPTGETARRLEFSCPDELAYLAPQRSGEE